MEIFNKLRKCKLSILLCCVPFIQIAYIILVFVVTRWKSIKRTALVFGITLLVAGLIFAARSAIYSSFIIYMLITVYALLLRTITKNTIASNNISATTIFKLGFVVIVIVLIIIMSIVPKYINEVLFKINTALEAAVMGNSYKWEDAIHCECDVNLKTIDAFKMDLLDKNIVIRGVPSHYEIYRLSANITNGVRITEIGACATINQRDYMINAIIKVDDNDNGIYTLSLDHIE